MRTIEQNHYEFLGVESDAPVEEIRRAVDKLRELFAPDSIALYSLVDREEHRVLLDRLEEAAVVLADERARLAYDERHGLLRRAPEPPRAQAYRDSAAQLDLPMIVGTVDLAPAWPGSRGTEIVEPVDASPDASPPGAGSIARIEAAVPDETGLRAEPTAGVDALAAAGALPLPGPAAPATLTAAPRDRADSEPAVTTAELEVDVELDLEEEPAATALAPIPATPKGPARQQSLPPMPELGAATEYDGALLRQIREAQGMTLRDLANRTRISLGHLEHIEAEAFRELPERVYLRGFLLAYARELKLDGPRLVETYLARRVGGR